MLRKIASTIVTTVRRFGRQESGPTAIEYAVLLGMIVAVIGFSVSRLARTLNDLSEEISAAVGQVLDEGGEKKSGASREGERRRRGNGGGPRSRGDDHDRSGE